MDPTEPNHPRPDDIEPPLSVGEVRHAVFYLLTLARRFENGPEEPEIPDSTRRHRRFFRHREERFLRALVDRVEEEERAQNEAMIAYATGALVEYVREYLRTAREAVGGDVTWAVVADEMARDLLRELAELGAFMELERVCNALRDLSERWIREMGGNAETARVILARIASAESPNTTRSRERAWESGDVPNPPVEYEPRYDPDHMWRESKAVRYVLYAAGLWKGSSSTMEESDLIDALGTAHQMLQKEADEFRARLEAGAKRLGLKP